jgi:hypothetical protein
LTRLVRFGSAYDKRHDPDGDFGIHGVDIAFILSGPKGGTEFEIMTNWYLPQNRNVHSGQIHTFGSYVSYHAKSPQTEGQQPCTPDCEVTGGVCYRDGSGVAGDQYFELLVAGGDEAIWKLLERKYEQIEWVPEPVDEA